MKEQELKEYLIEVYNSIRKITNNSDNKKLIYTRHDLLIAHLTGVQIALDWLEENAK